MEDTSTYVDKIKKGDTTYDFRDTTSGYLVGEAGEIEEGGTGYVNGGQVYEVIGNIESLLKSI